MPNGYQALGEAIGGLFTRNRGAEERAYTEALLRGYQGNKAMEEARRARDINLAYDKITPEAIAAAYSQLSPGQAELMAAQQHAQGTLNLNTLGQTLGDMQDYALKAKANEALGATLGEGNAALAALAGKPVQMAKVEGNTLISPYQPLGEQKPQISPFGQATVDAGVKKANISAGAGVQKAQIQAAAKGRGGGRPQANVLAEARARIAGGTDPEVVAEHLRKKGYPAEAKKIYSEK